MRTCTCGLPACSRGRYVSLRPGTYRRTTKRASARSPEVVFANTVARPGSVFFGTRSVVSNVSAWLASRVASYRVLPSCRKKIVTPRAGVTPSQPEEKSWPRRRNFALAAARDGAVSMEGQAVAAPCSPAADAPALAELPPLPVCSGLPTRRSRVSPPTLRPRGRPGDRRGPRGWCAGRVRARRRRLGPARPRRPSTSGRGRAASAESGEPSGTALPRRACGGRSGPRRVLGVLYCGAEVPQALFDPFFGEPPVVRHLTARCTVGDP
jgi:hypothetical protein